MAEAINGQTERHREAAERHPRPRPIAVDASGHHAEIDRRYREILARYPAGSVERGRLSACRLATPQALVLDRACDDLGGAGPVGDVLAWAWEQVARGTMVTIGQVPAAQALRDAFRGEGRYWRGVVEAHAGSRPPDAARGFWTPPKTEAVPEAAPGEIDRLVADWRARTHVSTTAE